eukprot:gnl/Ergobibamus_cyprinoides/250.p1 GENE.gnl/Ergobibamus_cyprinoides/250~~gnl/Ergobibamus_cyprinoides/250.p1  ORF type:complete len:154 (+),score=80.87 gnl/Ergobibamus_cyprinoides/250:35-463(+)
MGHVRTKTIKKAAREIIERYYTKLGTDFQVNKRVCDEVAQITSKKVRNQIAGYVTHLMARIQEGPVRGISLKLQEEERERRDNYIPDVSGLTTEVYTIDQVTKELITKMGFDEIATDVHEVKQQQATIPRRPRREVAPKASA